jgi:hypothetical protein
VYGVLRQEQKNQKSLKQTYKGLFWFCVWGVDTQSLFKPEPASVGFEIDKTSPDRIRLYEKKVVGRRVLGKGKLPFAAQLQQLLE